MIGHVMLGYFGLGCDRSGYFRLGQFMRG